MILILIRFRLSSIFKTSHIFNVRRSNNINYGYTNKRMIMCCFINLYALLNMILCCFINLYALFTFCYSFSLLKLHFFLIVSSNEMEKKIKINISLSVLYR
ncbi:hypothetical protein GLOIN_2v1867383 [Rhizophagus irregularis DAOM 181602=DAOM 197198]|nr:hypothetical protein GLOIN_2v1867383 [Rhizophagus irregularis DAOM 181602=DAOM 197198]